MSKPDNAFTRNGIDIEEWNGALVDAMRTGGAPEEEIGLPVGAER
jgi:hypothetical protein